MSIQHLCKWESSILNHWQQLTHVSCACFFRENPLLQAFREPLCCHNWSLTRLHHVTVHLCTKDRQGMPWIKCQGWTCCKLALHLFGVPKIKALILSGFSHLNSLQGPTVTAIVTGGKATIIITNKTRGLMTALKLAKYFCNHDIKFDCGAQMLACHWNEKLLEFSKLTRVTQYVHI